MADSAKRLARIQPRQRGKPNARPGPSLLKTEAPQGQRECGLCHLCEEIEELSRPAPVRHGVVHLELPPDPRIVGLGALRERGGCLWARGLWGYGMETRPDRTGVVPWAGRVPNSIRLLVHPTYPTAWRRNAVCRLVRVVLDRGQRVFVNVGPGPELVVRGAGNG